MSMREFNAKHDTMMYDPQIEASIRDQHAESSEFQEFKLERTDLMTREERAKYFAKD